MKKLIYLFVMVIVVSGCAGVDSERMDKHINTYRMKLEKQGHELLLDMSYKDSFDLVLEAFKQYQFIIRRKDYEGKVILADGDLKNPGLLLNTPIVFFEPISSEQTKLRIIGGRTAWWKERIEEAAKFQKSYNE